MKKVLVTGVSGFLGWHICEAARERGWQVTGVSHTRPAEIDGVDVRRLDLCDSQAVASLLSEVEPDGVIHAAAMANPNQCEVEPEMSQAVNVNATLQLAELCRQRGVRLVFTSTDLVFDGEHAPYAEDAATGPVNIYGRHKLAAEQGVLAAGGVVCRMPLMFGNRADKPASFIGGWFKALAAGQELTLFYDEIRTPVSGSAAAAGLLLALETDVQGVLHLGGPEPVTRYDFGLKFCEVFGYDPALIKSVPAASVTMAAPRARNVALLSERAFALGYNPGSVLDQLQALWFCHKNFS